MDQKKIGHFLAELRKERKYTQREVAVKLGLSEKTISKWECGNGLPEIVYMEPLCTLLGITVSELIAGEHISIKALQKTIDQTEIELVKQKEFEQQKKRMKYFETHAHPDHPLVEDKEGYILNMREAGIEKIVVAPITYESNYLSMDLFPEELYPDVLFAKGLHPKCAINSRMWSKKEKENFFVYLTDKRVVAVKSGIDLCKKNLQDKQIQKQYEFLRMFMDMARDYNKSLMLHIREAAEEAIAFFEENPLYTKTEVHCFTYDMDVMKRFIKCGIHYFGIGGMVTRSENVLLQEAVKAMPLEMILLESDSPFVKVEGETDRINSSAKALPKVARRIAELKGITEAEVVLATYENACRFFGLCQEKAEKHE